MSFTIAYIIIGMLFALGYLFEFVEKGTLSDYLLTLLVFILVTFGWPAILFTADKDQNEEV